jgi:hypothetical protein
LISAARRRAWVHYRADVSISLAEAASVAGLTRQSLAETAREFDWQEVREAYLRAFDTPESLPAVVVSVLSAAGRRSAALSDLLDRQLLALPPNPTLEQVDALARTHDRLTRLSLDLLARMIGAPQ